MRPPVSQGRCQAQGGTTKRLILRGDAPPFKDALSAGATAWGPFSPCPEEEGISLPHPPGLTYVCPGQLCWLAAPPTAPFLAETEPL